MSEFRPLRYDVDHILPVTQISEVVTTVAQQ